MKDQRKPTNQKAAGELCDAPQDKERAATCQEEPKAAALPADKRTVEPMESEPAEEKKSPSSSLLNEKKETVVGTEASPKMREEERRYVLKPSNFFS